MDRLKSLFKAMAKGGNSNLRVFSVCLAIAFVLWLFQSMSREYTTDIELPIEYTNLPADKIFSVEPINKLQLKVTGFGWDLWAYKSQFNKPKYSIDLSKQGNNNVISLNSARDLIVESIPGLTNILSLQPETINLDLDEAMKKTVPVVSALNIIPSNGYGFSSAYPEPDSVEIYGPKKLVKEIQHIKTEVKDVPNAQGKIAIDAKLETPEGISKTSHTKVSVKALIEPLTEKEIEVRIKVKGYKGNKKVNIYPRVATIKIQTTLSLFQKIEESDFEVYVDMSEMNTGNDDLLPLEVVNNSKLIKNLRVHPKYVNYFLEE